MRWWIVGLVAWLALLYGPHIWSASFVYEDHQLVQGSVPDVTVRDVMHGRGLSKASWSVIDTPRMAHLLNVGLHLLVIGLAGWLFTRLAGRRTGCVVATVLALHPLTVQAVAYAAGRAELMAAVAVLLALLCLTAQTAWMSVYVPVLLAVAYVSKETGIVGVGLLPVVVWLTNRAWGIRLAGLIGSGALMYALSQVSTLQVLVNVGEGVGFRIAAWEWVTMQGLAVWRLLILSVAPLWLTVDPPIHRDSASLVLFGALGMLAMALLECAWRARDRYPLFTAGIAWVGVVAAPRFVVQTPRSPFNEHQWYLAMPGVACVLVSLWQMADDQCAAWWGRRMCLP